MKNPFIIAEETALLVLSGIALAGFLLTGCVAKRPPVATPPTPQANVAVLPEPEPAPQSEPVIVEAPPEPQDPAIVKALTEYEKTKKLRDIPTRTGKKLVFEVDRQYVLTCSEWGVLTVRLLPGEVLLRTVAGNPAEWMIDDAVMLDANGMETPVVSIRRAPYTAPAEVTFLTDRNLYDFLLIPGKGKAGAGLRRYDFYDPVAEMKRKNGEVAAAQERKKKQLASRYPKLSFEHIRHYQVSGDRAVAWEPIKVMGDHERTFIEFPSATGTQQPTLTVIEDGKEVRPNVRTSPGRNGDGAVMTVDQSFQEGRLYGEGGVITISQGGE